MGRTKGALNKQTNTEPTLLLSNNDRIDLLAAIILEIILEEQAITEAAGLCPAP